MTAAEIAFSFLLRGIKLDLCLTQFAALCWLAANGEHDRGAIMRATGLSMSTRNSDAIVGKLVALGLVTQRLLTVPGVGGRGKFLHDITPKGLRALGLPVTSKAAASA
jgi:hypothetical protein